MNEGVFRGKNIVSALFVIEVIRFVISFILKQEDGLVIIYFLPMFFAVFIFILIFKGVQVARYIFAFTHFAPVFIAFPVITENLSNNGLDWVLMLLIVDQFARLLQGILIFIKPVSLYMRYAKEQKTLPRLGTGQFKRQKPKATEGIVGGKKYNVRD